MSIPGFSGSPLFTENRPESPVIHVGDESACLFRGVGEAEMLTEKAVALLKPGHVSGNGEAMAA